MPTNHTMISARNHPQHLYERLMASVDGIFWEADAHTLQFTYVSEQAERLLGYPVVAWTTADFWVNHLHPADREWVVAFWQRAIGEKRNHSFEYRMIAADGRTVWLRDVVSVVVAEATATNVCGIMIDVTEQKQAEERLRIFLDHASDAFFLHDQSGTVLDVNRRACEIFGYRREELIGMTPFDFDPSINSTSMAEKITRLTTGETVQFETSHRRKDGTIFPVEVRMRAVWEGGRQFHVALIQDITERTQAEAALRESEERYRILYEANPTMYFTIDLTGAVLSVNRFGAEQLGYTVAELAGSSVLQILPPEDIADAIHCINHCVAHPGEVTRRSLRIIRKDGSLFWAEETACAVRDVKGDLVVLIVCADITERRETEQALSDSHNLLQAVVESTVDEIFAKDREGRYLMINSAGAAGLGKNVAEIIGKDDWALLPPDDAHAIITRDQLLMATGESQTFEEAMNTPSGMRITLTTKGVYRDKAGAVQGIIGIARDITELKHLEEQFRQAQKMEAVGRLAGGVAHDFNNLLTVINGYSQLILKRLTADDPNRPRLAEIQKAGERAANLTRQLLAFSRKQMLQPQLVNLNSLLGELLKLLQRLIGEDVELILTPASDLGLTKVDPGQFEQAIINLAVNARDAMPHGGQLALTTYNTELDAETATHYPEVQAGAYVCVAISDTGVGMTEATKSRIFEPFFTTKEVGKGTGLGLAMVYGFVKQSGGHVEVYSEEGKGATFRICLPRTTEPGAPSSPALDLPDLPQGRETILLVEDEEAVRGLVRLVLQAGGYTVLEAEHGRQAIALATAHPGPIHLLITDLVMPQMSGRQLAEQISALRPAIHLLFMSGYTEEAVAHHQVRELNIAFLQKPFDPRHLAHKVRELLDRPGTLAARSEKR